MTLPTEAEHVGDGWYQLCLLDYAQWAELRRIPLKAYDIEATREPILPTPSRLDIEWNQWGGRWVALAMTGWFDDKLAPNGYKLRGISYHADGTEAMIRMTVASNGDGLVTFIKERKRFVWYELFLRATKYQIEWKPDKYHSPSV